MFSPKALAKGNPAKFAAENIVFILSCQREGTLKFLFKAYIHVYLWFMKWDTLLATADTDSVNLLIWLGIECFRNNSIQADMD